MASQVPYSGAPSVQPQDRPVPYTQLNVPGGAFGLGRAQATEQLGGAFQQAGGEIYARAVAMQELNEQAKANEAVANTQHDQLTSYVDFSQKRGNDAVQGLTPFMDGAEAIRQKNRAALSSPYAQRLYDNESRNATNRINFSAAMHAKQQLKEYTVDGYKAGMESAQRAVGVNPEDDATFNASMAKVESTARDLGQGEGWPQAKIDNYVQQQKEIAASNQVQGLIKSQPFTAKARLDKYVQSGLIGSQEGGRLGDAIQKAQYSTGARNISANTMAGADGKFGEGKVTPEQADLAISTVEGSGSWDPPHRMVTKGMYAGQYALGKFGVMQGNLQPWLKEAGMAPMSEAEFIQDHDAQTKLFRTRIMQYQEEGGSFNAAIRKWFTGSFNPAPGANDGGMTVEKYVANANAALARGADRSTVDRVSRQSAEEAAPGDHTFADIVSQHSEMQHSRDLQIQLDGERRNATTVASALLAGPDGKLPMSVEELRQDPKIAAAYDGMSLPDQIKVQNHLQANITKGGYAFTPQSKADYMGFVGAYNNPQRSPEDTDKLLNMDIMAQHWPTAEKKQALVMYGKLMDREAADPHMAYPLQVLDSMMAGAEIDTKRDSQGHHKDDYNQFVGALTEVYKDSMKENAQRPKENEIKVMGSRLIQDLTRYRRSIFQPIQKYYQMDVPDDVIESTKEAYRKAYNAEPSDTEIHSLAVATQYQRLYGRKPKASP